MGHENKRMILCVQKQPLLAIIIVSSDMAGCVLP